MSRSFSLPIATSIKECLREGYSKDTLKSDIGAGIVVSLVALPLSMALAIAVGLPPQHGLYTAIIAGIVTALLGGSRLQVSGPTAAFVAILAPIVSEHGLTGLIWCQLMAGCFLILMGWMRVGKYIEHIPYAVITGFTAGIAVVIATLSLNDFLGLEIAKFGPHYADKVMEIWARLPNAIPQEAIIGIVTIVSIVGFGRITQKIPAPVFGIVISIILTKMFIAQGFTVHTIDTNFSYLSSGGEKIAGVPPYLPSLHWPAMMDLWPLLWPAITVAMLAGLESLLSATIADNKSETKHDPNAELTGIGFGNLFSGMFAGIPATGALARTAANIQAGAKTPVAAIIHSLLLLFYMVAFAKWIGAIPMAALAALLLVTAYRMAHIHLFVDVIRAGNKKDTTILLVTFALTITVDMVVGVGAGLILSYMFHILKRD